MRDGLTYLAYHHIIGHLVFLLVFSGWVMMCPTTDNTASCEIRAVIRFLRSKNLSAGEICHELYAIYSQNIIHEGTVRQWCRMFKDGRANNCSQWRAKWSAICNEWFSCSMCWPKKLWNTALHNFRSFVWISTTCKHCSLRDYHRLGCRKFYALLVLLKAHRMYLSE
jgi:hypothetical protein